MPFIRYKKIKIGGNEMRQRKFLEILVVMIVTILLNGCFTEKETKEDKADGIIVVRTNDNLTVKTNTPLERFARDRGSLGIPQSFLQWLLFPKE